MTFFKIQHIIKATGNSLAGIRAAFHEEHAVREIALLTAVGIPVAFLIADTFFTVIVLVVPFFICLIVELLNSALENVCDKITTDFDIFIKKAKDMGSAAQFFPKFYSCLHG